MSEFGGLWKHENSQHGLVGYLRRRTVAAQVAEELKTVPLLWNTTSASTQVGEPVTSSKAATEHNMQLQLGRTSTQVDEHVPSSKAAT